MKKISGSRSRKQRLTAVGTRCSDHVTPLFPQKLALTSPTGGGRSVGIVRVRTKATEFSFLYIYTFTSAVLGLGGRRYSYSIVNLNILKCLENSCWFRAIVR